MKKYIDLAYKQAKKAYQIDEVPVGAVIVKDDKVIATGYNQKEKRQSVTKHAELIAIERATKKIDNWRLDQCDIFITLEPCPMCASAIQQSRIRGVYYGCSCADEKTSEIVQNILKTVDRNRSVVKIVNYDDPKCQRLLQKYFEEKRKQK